jgi:hypothetical protein
MPWRLAHACGSLCSSSKNKIWKNNFFDAIELNNDVSSTHYTKESPLKDDYKTCSSLKSFHGSAKSRLIMTRDEAWI